MINDLPLKIIADNRRKKAEVALFCPVGDKNQLIEFLKVIRKLDYHDKIDCLFIYPRNFEIDPEDSIFDGLSIIHMEETLPIGTSGAFFCGSYFLYLENYNFIIIADIDAFPGSNDFLFFLLKEAKEKSMVILPICKLNESTEEFISSISHWGIFPHFVFEKVGFYTPYMWRGAEDYDLMIRLNKNNLLDVNTDLFFYHPKTGYTIFHKMAEKKKFYPYVTGLMKVFLFHSERDIFAVLKFFAWFMFYAFFGDAFSDRDIFMMLSKCNKFTTEYNFTDPISKVEIKRIKETAAFQSSFFDKILKEPKLLISLLIFKKAHVYTDEIQLNITQTELLLGIAKAFFLVPFRFIQSIYTFMKWKDERKKVVYPVTIHNIEEAIKIYKRFLTEKKL